MVISMSILVEDFGEMQSSMISEAEPKKLDNGSLVENSIRFINEKPKQYRFLSTSREYQAILYQTNQLQLPSSNPYQKPI